MLLSVPEAVLSQTFEHFRACGRGVRECQALWLSSWQTKEKINAVEHPKHRAHAGGFELDQAWLHAFWLRLGDTGSGVRVQVHTHPREAFHSPTDDLFPIVHAEGFLSLVIPDFGMGAARFDDAYLCEIGPQGSWRQVAIQSRLRIV